MFIRDIPYGCSIEENVNTKDEIFCISVLHTYANEVVEREREGYSLVELNGRFERTDQLAFGVCKITGEDHLLLGRAQNASLQNKKIVVNY